MLIKPFENHAQYTTWQLTINHSIGNVYDCAMLIILHMEMWWIMIIKKHHDDDSVEFAYLWHIFVIKTNVIAKLQTN